MREQVLGLLNLLEEEFRNFDVRVLPVFPSGTERSIDLVQDYDPESSDVHARSGVKVLTGRREYFFPEEWLTERARTRLHRQIEEIRESLS